MQFKYFITLLEKGYILIRSITNLDTFNGYNININYNKSSNKSKISKPLLIITNVF